MNKIYEVDNRIGLKTILDGSVDLILTSPPYNADKEYEQKRSLKDYITEITLLFADYYRVLKSSGSICFQVGNYIENGCVYPLDCIFFSYFLDAGFIPRNRIVWSFGHGLHCKNRFSGRHETILWFTKSNEYKFNLDAVRIPQKYPDKKHFKGNKIGELSGNPLGKNPSDVWDITNVKNNHPEKTAHPCQFPLELANRCIDALTDEGDIVLDPYGGSGTTALAAKCLNRDYILFELNPDYIRIAEKRLYNEIGIFNAA